MIALAASSVVCVAKISPPIFTCAQLGPLIK